MAKQDTYIKRFKEYKDAKKHLEMRKTVNQMKYWHWALIDGPNNDFAVVDLNTAIGMNVAYEF